MLAWDELAVKWLTDHLKLCISWVLCTPCLHIRTCISWQLPSLVVAKCLRHFSRKVRAWPLPCLIHRGNSVHVSSGNPIVHFPWHSLISLRYSGVEVIVGLLGWLEYNATILSIMFRLPSGPLLPTPCLVAGFGWAAASCCMVVYRKIPWNMWLMTHTGIPVWSYIYYGLVYYK